MNLPGVNPPGAGTSFDTPIGWEWAERLTKLVLQSDNTAIFTTDNLFTGTNVFENAPIGNTNILLALTNYGYEVAINLTSNNAATAGKPGGTAALYIQHLIDSSTATANQANIGLRVQIESSQKSTAGTNDEVAVYAGIFQAGQNVGGFGYHLDYYYAGSGPNSTGYGVNVEMNRNNSTGVLVGYHLRIIQSAFSTVGTDYGFLVSPSPAGALACNVLFSGGSSVFGVIFAVVGLDLAYAVCGTAIRIGANQNIQYDGIGGFIVTRYNSGAGTWEIYNGVNLVWAVNLFSGKTFYKGPFTTGGNLSGTTNLISGVTTIPIAGLLTVNVAGTDYNIPLF